MDITEVQIKKETELVDDNLQIEDEREINQWLSNMKGNLNSFPDIPKKVGNDEVIENVYDPNSCFFNQIYCKYCNRTFENEDTHKKFVSSEIKKYYCHDHCLTLDKVFTKHEFIDHCRENSIDIDGSYIRRAMSKIPRITVKERSYQCEICSVSFGMRMKLEKHYDTHHENQYVCEECNAGFKKIMQYTLHLRIHNEHNLYQCPLCSSTKQTMEQIRAHLYQRHEQLKKYKCDICDKRFWEYQFFQQHVQYFHSGEKPFVCDQCDKKFVYSRYLWNHKHRCHDHKVPEKIVCPFCGKSLINRQMLQIHCRGQHSNEVFICDTCEKAFTSMSNLNQHNRIHMSD